MRTVKRFVSREDEEQHRAYLSGTVLSEETVPLTVVEREGGVLDQETAMERERVRVDVDVTGLRVRSQDTVS